MDGPDVPAACSSFVAFVVPIELSRLSIPGASGPRLLAGAMHVAWRQRYPVARTGRGS